MTEDLSIFQEIDESLRVDNLEKFLRNYGKLVIACCIGIVLATAVYVFWKNHTREGNMVQTGILLDAQKLIDSGKNAEATQTLEKVEQGHKGVASIAKLMNAEMLANNGTIDKAIETFKAIANDSANDLAIRDLATINASVLANNNNLPYKDDDLKKLYVSKSPFSTLAGELYALNLQKAGNSKEAKAVLTDITNDSRLSNSQRTQAKEILDSVTDKK